MSERASAATATGHVALRIEGRASEALLRDAHRRVDDWAAQGGSSQAMAFQIKLVTDELLTNVINHGTVGDVAPQATLCVVEADGAIEIHFADNGPAFDPLSLPPPDVDAPLDEREPGGLGVHLVRELMDSVSYRREKGWNRLTLVCRDGASSA